MPTSILPIAMQQKTTPNSPKGVGAPIDIAPIVQKIPNISAITPPKIRPTAPAAESVTLRRKIYHSIQNAGHHPARESKAAMSKTTDRVLGLDGFVRQL